jgi:hypothetical protein
MWGGTGSGGRSSWRFAGVLAAGVSSRTDDSELRACLFAACVLCVRNRPRSLPGFGLSPFDGEALASGSPCNRPSARCGRQESDHAVGPYVRDCSGTGATVWGLKYRTAWGYTSGGRRILFRKLFPSIRAVPLTKVAALFLFCPMRGRRCNASPQTYPQVRSPIVLVGLREKLISPAQAAAVFDGARDGPGWPYTSAMVTAAARSAASSSIACSGRAEQGSVYPRLGLGL